MKDVRIDQPFGWIFLGLVTIGLAVVLYPFWRAIFWAVIFAILFWPLRQRWMIQFGGRSGLTAILIVLLILFFILIPAFIIGGLIADSAALLVANAKEGLGSGALQPGTAVSALKERFPNLFAALQVFGIDPSSIQQALQNAAAQVGEFAVGSLVTLGQGAASFALQLFLMLYLLFALLTYGDKIFDAVFRALPLDDYRKRTFASTFASMAVATLKGTAAVAIVQGMLGGLIFWLLGIDSAIFWGAIMGLLSVVPPFGAGFIWGPVAVMLGLQGDWGKGLILIAYGTLIISMSDNVVRPILVGRASSVPDYLVLLTTLGGLASFGLTGLVLGPVIAALFLSAWQLQNKATAPMK